MHDLTFFLLNDKIVLPLVDTQDTQFFKYKNFSNF